VPPPEERFTITRTTRADRASPPTSTEGEAQVRLLPGTAAALAFTASPHDSQNRAPAPIPLPQRTQVAPFRGVPHSEQNLPPAVAPHDGHVAAVFEGVGAGAMRGMYDKAEAARRGLLPGSIARMIPALNVQSGSDIPRNTAGRRLGRPHPRSAIVTAMQGGIEPGPLAGPSGEAARSA
jgi:hypothetical protein